MLGILLDLLFPDYCLVCGKLLLGSHHFVACSECWKEHFTPYSGVKCKTCGYPLKLKPGSFPYCRECIETGRHFEFKGVDYFGLYDGLIEIAIRELKQKKLLPVAREIGKSIRGRLLNFIHRTEANLVVPVPESKEMLKERGFSPVEEILKGADIRFRRVLGKKEGIMKQSLLGKRERRKNVKDAFYPLTGLNGNTVLLFDDILTTGATADECAKALKEAGAREVYLFTVARSV
ncbi:MAG: ComF family protein [Desulfurobacteriaceae bacterium]